MDAVAEAEVLRLGAIAVDVERVGIGQRSLIAVGGAADQEHRLALGDRRAVQVHVLMLWRTLYCTGLVAQ